MSTTDTEAGPSIFQRLAWASENDSAITAEDEGGQDLRLYDAATGEMVERVTSFRLSDSTFWVLDTVEVMNARTSETEPLPQPDFERPRLPDDIRDLPVGDERTRRIKVWRASPEVQAFEARYDAWRQRPEVEAAFDEHHGRFIARHTTQHRRPFYVEQLGTPGRRWYSR